MLISLNLQHGAGRKRLFFLTILLFLFVNTSFAQSLAYQRRLDLPVPGKMVSLSEPLRPASLKGIKVDPKNPLKLQFILDKGSGGNVSKAEVQRLIYYFMAALTMPQKDLWVNLSPYEKSKVLPDSLVGTDIGNDMLAQDYLLKQLAASLTHPDTAAGRDYWSLTDGKNTSFQKVWILPDKAKVYQKGNTAIIIEASLKAMTDRDYNAMAKKGLNKNNVKSNDSAVEAFKTIILPMITQDINYGKNFASLRQIYNSVLLAVWFKSRFDQGFYGGYIDKHKVSGIDTADRSQREGIYALYVEAFKRGAYDYAKQERVSSSRSAMRRYFCGGVRPAPDSVEVVHFVSDGDLADVLSGGTDVTAYHGQLDPASPPAVPAQNISVIEIEMDPEYEEEYILPPDQRHDEFVTLAKNALEALRLINKALDETTDESKRKELLESQRKLSGNIIMDTYDKERAVVVYCDTLADLPQYSFYSEELKQDIVVINAKYNGLIRYNAFEHAKKEIMWRHHKISGKDGAADITFTPEEASVAALAQDIATAGYKITDYYLLPFMNAAKQPNGHEFIDAVFAHHHANRTVWDKMKPFGVNINPTQMRAIDTEAWLRAKQAMPVYSTQKQLKVAAEAKKRFENLKVSVVAKAMPYNYSRDVIVTKGNTSVVVLDRDANTARKMIMPFYLPGQNFDLFNQYIYADIYAALNLKNNRAICDLTTDADGNVLVYVDPSGTLWIEQKTLEGPVDMDSNHWDTLSIADQLDVIISSGRDLEAMHAAGVVHCDYKPANVIYTKNGPNRKTKIIDLTSMTRAGGQSFMCTQMYSSVSAWEIFQKHEDLVKEYATSTKEGERADILKKIIAMEETMRRYQSGDIYAFAKTVMNKLLVTRRLSYKSLRSISAIVTNIINLGDTPDAAQGKNEEEMRGLFGKLISALEEAREGVSYFAGNGQERTAPPSDGALADGNISDDARTEVTSGVPAAGQLRLPLAHAAISTEEKITLEQRQEYLRLSENLPVEDVDIGHGGILRAKVLRLSLGAHEGCLWVRNGKDDVPLIVVNTDLTLKTQAYGLLHDAQEIDNMDKFDLEQRWAHILTIVQDVAANDYQVPQAYLELLEKMDLSELSALALDNERSDQIKIIRQLDTLLRAHKAGVIDVQKIIDYEERFRATAGEIAERKRDEKMRLMQMKAQLAIGGMGQPVGGIVFANTNAELDVTECVTSPYFDPSTTRYNGLRMRITDMRSLPAKTSLREFLAR